MKKNKKILIVVISILLIGVITIILFVWCFFTGGLAEKTNNIDFYGNWHGFLGKSNLLIFPEILPKPYAEIDYYYYNRDEFNIASTQIYLKCTYNMESSYRKEVERLKKINNIVFDNKSYPYPAYVASQNTSIYEYEYVLLLDNSQEIVYIFNKNCQKKTFKIPKKYLPKNMYSDSIDSFSIYSNLKYDEYIYFPYSLR